jgi:hypothetical protein
MYRGAVTTMYIFRIPMHNMDYVTNDRMNNMGNNFCEVHYIDMISHLTMSDTSVR